MVEITSEEWSNWKQEKVTQEFLKRLTEKREQLKEGMAEGQASTNKWLHEIIGQCQALKDAVEYAIRDFEVIRLEEKNENAI